MLGARSSQLVTFGPNRGSWAFRFALTAPAVLCPTGAVACVCTGVGHKQCTSCGGAWRVTRIGTLYPYGPMDLID